MAENGDGEYAAEDVRYKMVISHVPFPLKRKEPFDIESEIYTKWCKLLKEYIKPDMILSGHTHRLSIDVPGGETDAYGQPCTVVVGSAVENFMDEEKACFVGTGLVFHDGCIDVSMMDSNGKCVCATSIKKG